MAKTAKKAPAKGHHGPAEIGGQIGALASRLSQLEQLVESMSTADGAAKADTGDRGLGERIEAYLVKQTGGKPLPDFLSAKVLEAVAAAHVGKSEAGTPAATSTARDALRDVVRELIQAELIEIRKRNPLARI